MTMAEVASICELLIDNGLGIFDIAGRTNETRKPSISDRETNPKRYGSSSESCHGENNTYLKKKPLAFIPLLSLDNILTLKKG